MEKKLHIQTPVEEVFEPLNISAFMGSFHILPKYLEDIGCSLRIIRISSSWCFGDPRPLREHIQTPLFRRGQWFLGIGKHHLSTRPPSRSQVSVSSKPGGRASPALPWLTKVGFEVPYLAFQSIQLIYNFNSLKKYFLNLIQLQAVVRRDYDIFYGWMLMWNKCWDRFESSRNNSQTVFVSSLRTSSKWDNFMQLQGNHSWSILPGCIYATFKSNPMKFHHRYWDVLEFRNKTNKWIITPIHLQVDYNPLIY